MKIQTLKFIRNIIIGIIALVISAIIVNISPGYKRDKYKNVINLVVEDTNVTEELKNPIYINENGKLYLSNDDIEIITREPVTYTLAFIYKNEIAYTALQDIEQELNVKVQYIEKTKTVIVDKIGEQHPNAQVTEQTEIRYKQRRLSKIVGNLNVGDTVTTFYTTKKGWTKIRTEDGTVGFIRSEKLTKVEEIK